MRTTKTLFNVIRRYSQATQGGASKSLNSAPPKPTELDVPGLSSNCVRPATGQLGPGASKTGEYKVPEYFCYSRISYAEAEVELAKYRCPQPSAVNE